MKINTLKKLDRNDFERIVIRKAKYNEIVIDIKNNSNVPTTKLTYPKPISERIKDLKVHDKVIEIIKYFIRSTSISFIKENVEENHFKDSFLIIGNNDRKLLINNKIKINKYIDEKLRKEIIKKYILDRERFIYNNRNIKNIEFKTNSYTGYNLNTKEDYIDGPYMEFTLQKINGIVSKLDERILLNLINNIIDNSNALINIEYVNRLGDKKSKRLFNMPSSYLSTKLWFKFRESQSYFDEGYGFFVYIDDYKIKIEEELYNKYFKEKVEKHNEVVKNQKNYN